MESTAIKASKVTFRDGQGLELGATVLRLERYSASFEVSGGNTVLRASEALAEFKILWQDRVLYSGRAIVRSFVHAGATGVCEVTLDDAWQDVEFPTDGGLGKLREQFQSFLGEWEKLYRIQPEYKIAIADLQSFLMDMRVWLNQVELGIRASPKADRTQLENEVADELIKPVIPCLDVLFGNFERIAAALPPAARPAHSHYMQRQLHPLVLCAPVFYRTFHKPLGYPGDYEVVNMIARNAHEGGSLFAKVVNTWFLRQPPAQAHRNRLDYLVRRMTEETMRAQRADRRARIFNIACGPAQEMQRFLLESPLSDEADFELLDFNDETLRYTRNVLNEAKARQHRRTDLHFVKKSVHQLLKESARTVARAPEHQYELVYCAGLFDYLANNVCQRLMDIMYDWVAPGGLLVATNVEPANPHRNGMEHLVDWYLVYRTGPQMRELIPRQASPENARVFSDDTGVNVFLEIRKPDHG